ncbi:MAG: hypothetical protein K9K82_05740 [Desulfobacteraceae bacterium]|nr:hypothetical protein [Desulfobacteraceae bacterium]
MKIALTVLNGRISPLFDSARTVLIVDVGQGGTIEKLIEYFEDDSAFSKARKLDSLGVNVLICGGISNIYATAVDACQIRLVPFTAGRDEEVLKAYLYGNINQKKFRMPGYALEEIPESK